MTPVTRLSRRELLAAFGLGAVAAALPGTPEAFGAFARALEPMHRGASPFQLRDVRLLDGPFREAQSRNARYLLSLDADRMLHNFRVNAGLEPKAPVYGGWESEEPWVDIRCHGHTLGHYLSALAMTHAATSEARYGERAAYVVSELRACQRARGDGLVCAFPDGARCLEDAIASRPFVGVPWYTMHKIFAGLRDAHTYAGTPDALAALVGLVDWTWNATRGMSDDEMQRMLDREHGGMTEVLADVSALAKEPKYLDLARRFAHRKVLLPVAEERDVLDGLHSNTQIPKFVGYQRVHELSGDATYGAAARFFWTTVTTRRSYVTGGNSDGEHFFPVAEFAKRLRSAKTMETCCTHNMLRLTRALFTERPTSAYADYYERALYNGILASQDPDSGMMTYFQATRPGYVRLYHTPEESFWCCTGTGIENHAKYGDSIYFHDADSLYVNLFIASEVTWRERGITLTQTTRFPDEDSTRLTIEADRPVRATLRVRRPAWCERMTVSVNRRHVRADADATGYVPVTRDWRAGDVVDVKLPMTLRTEPLPGASDLVAFVYGPIVLAGTLGTEGVTPADQIIKNERTSGNMLNAAVEVPVLVGDALDLARHVRPVPGEPLTFETVGLGRSRDVRLAPYFRLAHERYTLYWLVRAT
ncbi:MAG TPA: beta-L-arabinofuranosidase domain-containing protein [Gemmatimonadaceae bacterium]|nr:beta-L-arabinofuranosidase domain-containing protein [Gemmatimonadaceae bacterium]